MVVSYKLETDPDLLISKAKIALERYQHDLVIGNLLTTRKWEVVFVTPDGSDEWIRIPKTDSKRAAENGSSDPSRPNDPELEIESLIVPAVMKLHGERIQNYKRKK
jgi:phosphopantothenate-cysteine ligase